MLFTIPCFMMNMVSGKELVVRFQPESPVYVLETYLNSRLYDVMIHNIAIVNGTQKQISLENIRIEVIKNGSPTQILYLSIDDITQKTRSVNRIKEQGLLSNYNFFFRLDRLLDDETKLSSSSTLISNSALITFGHYISFSGIPDSFKVVAHGRTSEGGIVESSSSLKAEVYRQKNSFIFPLVQEFSIDAKGGDVYADVVAWPLDQAERITYLFHFFKST